jgi:hypothetical protein
MRVRHKHVLEDIPESAELCRMSGRNGASRSLSVSALELCFDTGQLARHPEQSSKRVL